MFLPENVATNDEKEKERRAAFQKIEAWSLEIIPPDIRNEASVSVQEVVCGDPECAPVDTAVTIDFARYDDECENEWRGHDIFSFLHPLIHPSFPSLSFYKCIFFQWLQWNDWASDGSKRSDERRAGGHVSNNGSIGEMAQGSGCGLATDGGTRRNAHVAIFGGDPGAVSDRTGCDQGLGFRYGEFIVVPGNELAPRIVCSL